MEFYNLCKTDKNKWKELNREFRKTDVFKSFFVNCIIFTILAFAMMIVNSIFMEEQLAIFGIVIINLTVLLFVGFEAVLLGIYFVLLKEFYNKSQEK